MPDLFETINDWLLSQALGDDDLPPILSGLAARLLNGGVPIARISVGRSLLHPVIGLIDMQWDRDSDQVTVQHIPRSVVRTDFMAENPFTDLAREDVDRILADLTDPDDVARYPIFADLAQRGLTGYAAYSRRFGTRQEIYHHISENFRGASLSFATRRFSGFSQADLAGLERIISALCTCIRVDNDRFVASEILETYLGRISGREVLAGGIERGAGRQIDCAILYSDMRNSVALSQQLDLDSYLDSLNVYFECTANAVAEHGGEVLKFIGDGVLAIFPFDDATRPRENMCAAALSSAREAFARAAHANRARQAAGVPDLAFGIALHAGTVIYGNVGTEKRLDFTATGPAVGLAARIEALTGPLGAPLLATEAFARSCPETGTRLPAQDIRGFPDPVDVQSYPAHS